ncbi:sigma-70 family RNA polymerase sigma factor [Myxococcota bacterium]|nr:sigma-70 family RNA polymerase sigma factor [Myxococcota bacterium]
MARDSAELEHRQSPSSQAASEAEIIDRARQGDHAAFGLLVARHQDRVYRLAKRVLRDEELARDVVQDSFLKAYRSLERFEGRSSFYTWLYRLVMNRCIDYKRRDRTPSQVELEEGRALDLAAGAVEGSGPEGGALGEVYRGELRSKVAVAIEALPEDSRQTFELREIDGLSYAEIARIQGIPKGTVMSRLHYARRRLREALALEGVTEAEGA